MPGTTSATASGSRLRRRTIPFAAMAASAEPTWSTNTGRTSIYFDDHRPAVRTDRARRGRAFLQSGAGPQRRAWTWPCRQAPRPSCSAVPSSRMSSAASLDEHQAQPWQTDTCIGSWHYDRPLYRRHGYKSAKPVVQRLADIVSKNGNLLLNIPRARRRHDRRERRGDPRSDRCLDRAQRRGDLRHAAVADIRRGPDPASAGRHQRRRSTALHRRGRSLHEEGRCALRASSSTGREGESAITSLGRMRCPMQRSSASTCSAAPNSNFAATPSAPADHSAGGQWRLYPGHPCPGTRAGLTPSGREM